MPGFFFYMNIILFDDQGRYDLLPFTHTRPVADIRCGIYTMRERWEHFFAQPTSTLTEDYLQPVFPLTTGADNVLINASIFANKELAAAIADLEPDGSLIQNGILIAARTTNTDLRSVYVDMLIPSLISTEYTGELTRIVHIWDIFSKNDAAIRADFKIITEGRTSQPLPDHVTALGKENIFIEEGAVLMPCIINATTGPVYIGKEAEVFEGCMLRGPLVVGEHAILKMGAKIYGATTIGPGCRAGGELSNVVMFANSNKGHDGFLGNAVIGEWCNLGADTNSSNLKNNYDEIKIWHEHTNRSVKTGLQFCGLLMGDHSKCGINTMFNTGTVVSVSANIFGGSFPEKFIPAFAWGGSESITTYQFERAMETAQRMMSRRNRTMTGAERNMYHHIFDTTKKQRDIFVS